MRNRRRSGTPLWALALIFLGAAAVTIALVVLLVPGPNAESLLRQGARAFESGQYAEAARLWESEGERGDILVRRYNAGVARLHRGELETAAERFEEVSARTRDERLRARAFRNLGFCRYQDGTSLSREATESEDVETRKEKLVAAAQSYHAAIDFYQRVTPDVTGPDDTTDADIRIAKTALRAVLDLIAQLEAEEQRKKEDELLKDPASLLRALMQREKVYRSASRTIASQAGRHRRLGSRSLRKAEEKNRSLTERLVHSLTREPAEGEQEPPEEERKRNAEAADIVRRAIESQKQAEIAYGKLDPAGATEHHTAAIRELRNARTQFAIELPHLVAEGIATQDAALTVSRSIHDAAAGGDGTGGGTAGGDVVVEALGDDALEPIAKLLTPTQKEEIRLLADEEEDVEWVSAILSHAEVPATPEQPAGTPPGHPGAGQQGPQLSEEEAKKLSESIQDAGKRALEAATVAKRTLAEEDLAGAIPHEETALAALREIEALLPKPPETPEQRLEKLIARQKEAATVSEGLTEFEAEAVEPASKELASRQRDDGREAGEIAAELEKRGEDERAKPAAEKVREGERHVFTSAESLDRSLPKEAGPPIAAAIEAFEEALEILQGEQDDDQQQGDDQQDRQDQRDQQDGKNDEQKDQGAYALSPRQARARKEEMDRKRREEEKKVLVASSGVAVDKDW